MKITTKAAVRKIMALAREPGEGGPPIVFSCKVERRNDKKCPECKGKGCSASDCNDGYVARAGDVRPMVCFLGTEVFKGLAGGERAYDPDEMALVWVYLSNLDPGFVKDGNNRRSINIDGIVELTIRGETFEVSPIVELAPDFTTKFPKKETKKKENA